MVARLKQDWLSARMAICMARLSRVEARLLPASAERSSKLLPMEPINLCIALPTGLTDATLGEGCFRLPTALSTARLSREAVGSAAVATTMGHRRAGPCSVYRSGSGRL